MRGEYLENMIHGLVLAYGVYQGQLKDFNGPLCNIDEVVNQLTPPESILAFVNEGDLTITSIHSLSACEYFGGKSSIVKFSKSLGESIGQGVINEDVIGSNIVLGLGDIDKVDMNSNTVNGGFNEAEINSDFVSDPIGEVEDITVFEPKACSSFLGAPGSNKNHAVSSSNLTCETGESSSSASKLGKDSESSEDDVSEEEDVGDEENVGEEEEDVGEEEEDVGEEEDVPDEEDVRDKEDVRDEGDVVEKEAGKTNDSSVHEDN